MFDKLNRRSLTTSFLLVSGVLLVVRLVVVALWSVVGEHAFTDNLWVELGLSILSYLILAAILGATATYYGPRLSRELRFDNIITATTTFAVSTLALLLFSAIVPNSIVDGRPADIPTVITSHLVAVGVYTISIGLAAFLTVAMLQRQHRGTRVLLIVLVVAVLGAWLSSILAQFNGFFIASGIVFLLLGSVVTLMNVRRLYWLSSITIDKKIRLLWLCACGAFAAFVLAMMLAFFEDAYATQSAHMFLRSGAILPAVVNVFGFVFFLRMFFATLASLPNSGIVDRRSNEVDALAGLTRLVAESVSVTELLESVTRHSLNVCRAHGAWCELYERGGLRVVGAQLVTPDFVRQLHEVEAFSDLIRRSQLPQHVESLSEVIDESASIMAVRSFISIPILSEARRIGTLVMFSTLEYGFEQDDVRLLSAFGNTISVGLDQARLVETALENERLQREFDVARRVQTSLLPKESPTGCGWQVDAITIPATQVGGDYYDYVEFANGHSGVIIADVSGKGVPAAFYMATLKGVVLAHMRLSEGPADLLRRINRTLFGSMERRVYISMACAEFDPSEACVRIARAGHTPVLVRSGGDVKTVTPSGMAIGLVPPSVFDNRIIEETAAVSGGDICLFTTDGVTERRNRANAEMSIEPLITMLNAANYPTASNVVQGVLDVIANHANGAEQHDDITIVVACITDAPATDDSHHRRPALSGILS